MTLRKLSSIAVLLAALGLAPAALAQTTTSVVTLQVAPGSVGAVNQQMCLTGANTAVAYSFPQGVPTGTTARIVIFLTQDTSCPSVIPTSDSSTVKILLADTTVTTANQSGIRPVAATTLGGTDCPINAQVNWIACAVARSTVSDINGVRDQVLGTASVNLSYDSTPPAAPVITDHSSGDSTIFLNWTAGEDAGQWIIFFHPIGPPPPPQTNDQCGNIGTAASNQTAGDGGEDAGVDAGPDAAVIGLDAGSVDLTGWSSTTIEDGTLRKGSIGGLVNGQRYEVLIVSRDIAGNDSAPSNIIEDKPVAVQDFYERYRCEGGAEKGGFGCSTAGMALFPIAGLAGLALLLRASRRKA